MGAIYQILSRLLCPFDFHVLAKQYECLGYLSNLVVCAVCFGSHVLESHKEYERDRRGNSSKKISLRFTRLRLTVPQWQSLAFWVCSVPHPIGT